MPSPSVGSAPSGVSNVFRVRTYSGGLSPGGRSIGDFLRDNLGARSLEPRDGDDADAVLSRAEGALKAGRLGDALAELETLPDASRAELTGWIELAETRRNAIAAAEELNASLSDC